MYLVQHHKKCDTAYHHKRTSIFQQPFVVISLFKRYQCCQHDFKCRRTRKDRRHNRKSPRNLVPIFLNKVSCKEIKRVGTISQQRNIIIGFFMKQRRNILRHNYNQAHCNKCIIIFFLHAPTHDLEKRKYQINRKQRIQIPKMRLHRFEQHCLQIHLRMHVIHIKEIIDHAPHQQHFEKPKQSSHIFIQIRFFSQ